MQRYNQRMVEQLKVRQQQEKARLPKIQRSDGKTRMAMYKKSLHISGAGSASEQREKIKQVGTAPARLWEVVWEGLSRARTPDSVGGCQIPDTAQGPGRGHVSQSWPGESSPGGQTDPCFIVSHALFPFMIPRFDMHGVLCFPHPPRPSFHVSWVTQAPVISVHTVLAHVTSPCQAPSGVGTEAGSPQRTRVSTVRVHNRRWAGL